jgi:hypothetical protein
LRQHTLDVIFESWKFGRRFSAAENAPIEERAVLVTREHFEDELGYDIDPTSPRPLRHGDVTG